MADTNRGVLPVGHSVEEANPLPELLYTWSAEEVRRLGVGGGGGSGFTREEGAVRSALFVVVGVH